MNEYVCAQSYEETCTLRHTYIKQELCMGKWFHVVSHMSIATALEVKHSTHFNISSSNVYVHIHVYT